MIASRFDRFYFIGIGGIGMSAIARLLLQRGFTVAGYDKTPSELTDALTAEGAQISFADEVSSIPAACTDASRTLVIVTPAVPGQNAIPQWFAAQGFEQVKRAKALGMITADGICLAVAGTHGKTTTTTLLAHLLMEAGYEFTALLGGVSANYQSNLLQTGTKYFVTEADEFDRSFLQLRPAHAAITSMDADHLDIYGTEAQMHAAYAEFAALCSHTLVYHAGLPLPLNGTAKAITYGAEGVVQAHNIRVENGEFVFDYVGEQVIADIHCGMPGLHNIENALAAITLALQVGVDAAVIRSAMASFRGVKRRFERIYSGAGKVFIDDYAHHPTEINALVASVRRMYPGKKVLGVFQPHLFSRTRDFLDGFADSLAALDECLLLDIYPARELPIEGISSAVLQAKIGGHCRLLAKESLVAAVMQAEWDVLLTIGAGDIDRLVQPLADAIHRKEVQA
ncbi:MAG: UDP-N-acetylmuramate--L-alanine ligase [Sphingobacteriaceae bacterium]|nr:UDP-N-acetylmuramate--L-alanine ligase [Sphingobacteriaceae bacterium]